MNTVKLYASATATTSAVVTFQAPRKMRVKSILWNHRGTCGTAAWTQWELSRMSSGQLTTNDAAGVLSECHGVGNTNNFGSSVLHVGIDFTLEAGDKIYLHTQVSGTITVNQVVVVLGVD